ncbi:MAG TPA: MFS transporter, partial [Acidimicrobiales bacterium]
TVASKILPKVGPRWIMVVGLGVASLGMFWLTQIGVNTSFAAHVLPAEILISLGMGMAFVPLSSTALHGVSNHDAGVASAMVNTTQQVGGSLGTALLNTLAASATAAYVGSHVPGAATVAAGQVHGYSVGALVGGVILAVAALAAFLLVKPGRHDVVATEAVLEPASVPA